MRYNITKATAPVMPNLGKGTKYIKTIPKKPLKRA